MSLSSRGSSIALPLKVGIDETEPYAPLPSIYNYYISSKARAEKLVLDADSAELSTAALRPGHIYGPGDAMIAIILEMRKSGDLPTRVGAGTNDYVYVNNLVDAHLQAAASLSKADSPTKGQAYFISDYTASVWEHMTPFLETAGLTVPAVAIPLWVVNLIACVVELYYGFMYYFLQMSICGRITRYSVTTTGQDFYTNTDKAQRHFGFDPKVSREEAVEITNEWVKRVITEEKSADNYFGGNKASAELSRNLRALYTLHKVYGYLLFLIGIWLFVTPDDASKFVGLPLTSEDSAYDDKWGRVCCNTSGIIVGVLGLYSIAAATAQWSTAYFRLTYLPKFLTCGALVMHVQNGKMPEAFLYPAAIEAFVGLATLVCLQGTPPVPPYKLHFDKVCVAQLLHAGLSGAFQIAMLLTPHIVLPMVMSDEINPDTDNGAMVWGRFMGASEIMMTWTYFLSGFMGGLEPFVRLSVVTRLMAFVGLATGWCFGLCVPEQVGGVMGDVVLAFFTIKALGLVPVNGRPVSSMMSCAL